MASWQAVEVELNFVVHLQALLRPHTPVRLVGLRMQDLEPSGGKLHWLVLVEFGSSVHRSIALAPIETHGGSLLSLVAIFLAY